MYTNIPAREREGKACTCLLGLLSCQAKERDANAAAEQLFAVFIAPNRPKQAACSYLSERKAHRNTGEVYMHCTAKRNDSPRSTLYPFSRAMCSTWDAILA